MILIDPILMQSISSLWSLGSFLHKQISTRPKKLVLASACLMSSAMDSCFWCRKNKWKWQTNKQVQDKSNQASSNKTKNSTKWGEVTEVTRSKVHVLELRILLLCCSQFIPGFTADSRQGQRTVVVSSFATCLRLWCSAGRASAVQSPCVPLPETLGSPHWKNRKD